ncbi:uncharacterized protein LOC122576909 isoform X2 [Bombus pyrosoma]|uniref:uncharacterized protein LOC122576909 isoform X2 n=1 Tax=Bombus pyrosoma TaxID=396416 RepID=UPI001CB9C3A8|nr:uncharacterized protein LOC122576909 isoform X2 [Bombus pyrosoma]
MRIDYSTIFHSFYRLLTGYRKMFGRKVKWFGICKCTLLSSKREKFKRACSLIFLPSRLTTLNNKSIQQRSVSLEARVEELRGATSVTFIRTPIAIGCDFFQISSKTSSGR